MTPVTPYKGPMALANSRYASARASLATPVTAPAIPAFTFAFPPNVGKMITTKEQPAQAQATAGGDAGAQLAVTQGNNLNEEVAQYSKHLTTKISGASRATRELLEILRDLVASHDLAALELFDKIWMEFVALTSATTDVQKAIPKLLEKQKDNMNLAHALKLNDVIKETEDEVNIQHNKVTIQNNLIREQQAAFDNFKDETSSKLKDMETLKERVSRLTLEKGIYRTEVDTLKQQLDQESLLKVNMRKECDTLHSKLKDLLDANKDLAMEREKLRRNIHDVQENAEEVEPKVTNGFGKDLKDALSAEQLKSASLTVKVDTLTTKESAARVEVDRMKQELKAFDHKYNQLATQYAQISTVSFPSRFFA